MYTENLKTNWLILICNSFTIMNRKKACAGNLSREIDFYQLDQWGQEMFLKL